MSNNIVVDIETVTNKMAVPAYEKIVCANCEDAGKKARGKEKSKCDACRDKYPLHWATGKVCCIGIKPVGESPIVLYDRDENALLLEATEVIEYLDPRKWIHFNGSSFDMVFLRMRSIINDTPFHTVIPDYRNQIDLFKVMMDGKWGIPGKLSIALASCGLQEHIYGTGAEVGQWYLTGQDHEIERHCCHDVCGTEKLYRRLVR